MMGKYRLLELNLEQISKPHFTDLDKAPFSLDFWWEHIILGLEWSLDRSIWGESGFWKLGKWSQVRWPHLQGQLWQKGVQGVKSGLEISFIRTLGWKHRVWFLTCIFVVRNYSFNQQVSVGCLLGTSTLCLVLSKILWVQLCVELDLGLKSVSLDLG